MIPIVFMACECTAWPTCPLFSLGKCGRCGVRPHTMISAPQDGKAYATRRYRYDD